VIEPPTPIITMAASQAMRSPCAKSKRGVVIFDPTMKLVMGYGYNGPPHDGCHGDIRCRTHCNKVAVHAEERAVRMLISLHDAVMPPPEMHLVHVKLGGVGEFENRAVAGGGPSCVTCSRTILDSGLVAFVWLFEAQTGHVEATCGDCSQRVKVGEGLNPSTTGVHMDECRAHPGSRVGGLLRDYKTIYDPDSGVWKKYTAREFHETTLRALGMGREFVGSST